jgi:[ribosomal protein S5]-alanine N-acetyltransferase
MTRFSLEPDALGEFEFSGYSDPQRWRREWEEDGMIGEDRSTLAVDVADGAFAGMVGWRPVITGADRGVPRRSPSSLETGIALLPEFRGRGYGSAAQMKLVDYLFAYTPVHRIQAVTAHGNVAEQRSLEKAGFRRDGVLREVGMLGGQWVDAVVYSILRDDRPPSRQG